MFLWMILFISAKRTTATTAATIDNTIIIMNPLSHTSTGSYHHQHQPEHQSEHHHYQQLQRHTEEQRQIPLTNDNIVSAVRLWMNDQNNNRTQVEALYGGELYRWDTSRVTNLDRVFAGYQNVAINVTHWNTSQVESLEQLFYQTTNLTVYGLQFWDTSRVTSTAYMLQESRNFYGGNLGELLLLETKNPSNMINTMEGMFQDAINVRGGRTIGTNWITSKVKTMKRIFYNTTISFDDDDDDTTTNSNNNNNPVPDDAELFYLCWDLSGLTDTDDLDEAFCHSNAGGFNCDCVRQDMVDRINSKCNTTRQNCFQSLSTAEDLDNNNNNNITITTNNDNADDGDVIVDSSSGRNSDTYLLSLATCWLCPMVLVATFNF